MRQLRWWQYGGALGLVSLVALCGGGPVSAQEAEEAEPVAAEEPAAAEEVTGLEDLKVIGSRVQGRSAQESVVPVDIIRGEDLQTYGIRDMDSLLAATVPSYNVNQQPISDASTLMRPPTLRGLPPDSTLVLVNGKRRHRGSVIALNSDLVDGSQGVDISAIPSIALEQVEVLRDGAAAQYGSDAIAGVLNFKLREDTEGLTVQTSYGQTYHGDGDKVNVAANLGLPLTENGFANFSFEFMNADETSRSVQRRDARGLIEAGNEHVRQPAAQIWGAPEVQYDYKFFGNLGLDLEEFNSRLYAFGNYAERKVEGGFFFRNPNTRGGIFDGGDNTLKIADLSGTGAGCPTVPRNPAADYSAALAGLPAHCFAFNERFPGGFTPRFGGYVQDWSIAFGVRGALEGLAGVSALLNGWSYDASASFGQSSVDLFMLNTINPQLAAQRTAIPTEYRPGSDTQFEKTFNLDLSRPVALGLFHSPLYAAFGFEYRIEEFKKESGGENSWYIDDGAHGLASQGFGIGSNGFPGYRPSQAGTFKRHNYALYMDLEAEVIRSLTIGVAGRYENFDGDIGETVNGKASARWQLLEALALRGAVSSGFRAPTPGQINLENVSTVFTDGKLADRVTLPGFHPAVGFFGGKPLTPEKSVNYSAGTVFALGDLEVTLDYYRIKVQDRIGRTRNFSISELSPADRKRFEALTVGGNTFSTVRFFANDFDTTTQGVDLVASYALATAAGDTRLTFVGNWNKTEVDSRNSAVIDAKRVNVIEEALPEFRFSLTADHTYGPWRLLVRQHFYDDALEYHADSEALKILAGERWVTDVEASYTFLNIPYMQAATLAVGAENVFDQYPRKNPYERNLGARYPETSPFGFNGGFYYLRAGFEF